MALLEELRALLGQDGAQSFRLMGEDLVALSGARLTGAARAWEAELERNVPAPLRSELVREQAALLSEAREFVITHNKSVHTRIRGYLALGRRCRFEYPWPVVAVLGICEVLRSIQRVHALGLAGALLSRLGDSRLEELAEKSDDVLRRTNRGIFADSAPTVLYALRCHELRDRGRADLASLLLTGPLPVLMDRQTGSVAHALWDGLAITDEQERFRALAELTLAHFAREQAIFSHHIGSGAHGSGHQNAPARGLVSGALGRLLAADSVPAPRIVRGRLKFERYQLPDGFQMRDHDLRVREFSDAFVRSITGSIADYRVAVDYVIRRFGDRGEVADFGYGSH